MQQRLFDRPSSRSYIIISNHQKTIVSDTLPCHSEEKHSEGRISGFLCEHAVCPFTIDPLNLPKHGTSLFSHPVWTFSDRRPDFLALFHWHFPENFLSNCDTPYTNIRILLPLSPISKTTHRLLTPLIPQRCFHTLSISTFTKRKFVGSELSGRVRRIVCCSHYFWNERHPASTRLMH